MKERLSDSLGLIHFEVKDFTGRHLNHKQHDGGFHLEAIIVSDDFTSKNLVERHRLVYEIMGNLMQKEIHALSMKTLTNEEWQKSNCNDLTEKINKVIEILSDHPFVISNPENARNIAKFRIYTLKRFIDS